MFVSRDKKPNSFALPHSFFSSPASKKSKARGVDVAGSDAFSTPAAIVDDCLAFRTRSFLIRYVEEHVHLNDAGNFRIELDMASDMSQPVIIQVELMWCDLEEGDDGEPSGLKGEFASVASRSYRINAVASGVHAYVPLIYDDAHFCSTGMTVHSVLSDVRFRNMPLATAMPSGAAGITASRGSQVRVLNPTTFAEHLFRPPHRGAAALQRLRNSGRRGAQVVVSIYPLYPFQLLYHPWHLPFGIDALN